MGVFAAGGCPGVNWSLAAVALLQGALLRAEGREAGVVKVEPATPARARLAGRPCRGCRT